MVASMNSEPAYGAATLGLIDDVFARGVSRAAVLMRHSAREFDPAKHDLVNPLTDAGRAYSKNLGEGLPKQVHVRGYASPPERCMETAALAIDAHQQGGGTGTAVRPVESLGVFYALDQIKMWKGLQNAGGLDAYVRQWTEGRVPVDAMLPAQLAAECIATTLLHRLRTGGNSAHLDLCVTHDLSLMMFKCELLGEAPEEHPVAFLDGVVLFEADGEVWLQSLHSEARPVTHAVRAVS